MEDYNDILFIFRSVLVAIFTVLNLFISKRYHIDCVYILWYRHKTSSDLWIQILKTKLSERKFPVNAESAT